MRTMLALMSSIILAMVGGAGPAVAAPNDPTGMIEQKYYQPGPWAVTAAISPPMKRRRSTACDP